MGRSSPSPPLGAEASLHTDQLPVTGRPSCGAPRRWGDATPGNCRQLGDDKKPRNAGHWLVGSRSGALPKLTKWMPPPIARPQSHAQPSQSRSCGALVSQQQRQVARTTENWQKEQRERRRQLGGTAPEFKMTIVRRRACSTCGDQATRNSPPGIRSKALRSLTRSRSFRLEMSFAISERGSRNPYGSGQGLLASGAMKHLNH